MKKVNVAIFPCEAENAFELYRSLRYAPRFNVIGLSSCSGLGKHLYKTICEDVPYLKSDDFLEKFTCIIKEEDIEYIFPTHDEVALFLKENEHSIPAKILCSRLDTTKLCYDKKMLYSFFADYSFCPDVYYKIDDIKQFPVFLKPHIGQGSQKCVRANNISEVKYNLCNDDTLLCCEYLDGEEYTVDCFTNRHGELLFAGARSRDCVKMGISFSSRTSRTYPEIEYIANTLNNVLSFCGLWFFQVKKDSNGTFKLLEICTRIATTMGQYRQCGINFAQLALYDAMGFDVNILQNSMNITSRRTLQTHYEINVNYNYIYIDLDDTLIVNGHANVQMMAFIYQSLNSVKKVILITRHDGDIENYLEQFRICKSMFHDIIHITDNSHKSQFITHDDAIFIDNLFVEREDVSKNCGIPVFDVDAVESLLNIY